MLLSPVRSEPNDTEPKRIVAILSMTTWLMEFMVVTFQVSSLALQRTIAHSDHPALMHLSSKRTEASILTNNTPMASRRFSTAKQSSKAVTLVSRPCSTATLQLRCLSLGPSTSIRLLFESLLLEGLVQCFGGASCVEIFDQLLLGCVFLDDRST